MEAQLKSLKMKPILKILSILILFIAVLSCKKEILQEEQIEKIGAPIVTVGWHKAMVKIDLKNNNLDAYGICFCEENLTSTPTISNDTVHFNLNEIAILSNLKDNTNYYWKTFIQIEDTILYSAAQKFTTLKFPTLTTSVTDITYKSATIHGAFLTGYNPAYEKYISYYILEDTPVAHHLTEHEDFLANIEGLEDNTTYYACAYIENSINEKAYGNTASFLTAPYPTKCPEVETLYASDITTHSVKLWGIIINAGDPEYTEKGIIFSAFSNPNFDNGNPNPVIIPCDENSCFWCVIDNSYFSSGSTCYYRAYVKHSDCGVVYGATKSVVMP